MAKNPKKRAEIDDPDRKRSKLLFWKHNRSSSNSGGDTFGKVAEGIARFMGTPAFLAGMTVFCGVWLAWNTFMPESMQFDPRALNFTLLTLILSLQASYAAPLLLLSDNRQADRDRVQAEQDRQSNERAHATTDFITREIATLRLALNEVATRDYVRGELRDLLEDIKENQLQEAVKAELKAELKAQLRAEVEAELRAELQAESKVATLNSAKENHA